MLGHSLVILSDAHVGAAPAEVEEALLAFLDAVPTLGDALLVTGDLFQFWFAYRHVLPRRAFPVAARLDALARRVPVALVGGNHDRWGDAFWATRPGMRYGSRELRFDIGTRRVLATHGDGLAAPRGLRPAMQRAVGHPLTSALYRLIHPDLAVPAMRLAAPLLGGRLDTPAQKAVKSARQRAWALDRLTADGAIDVLVMGHTHVPALEHGVSGRLYLNPGAWAEGLRYATLTENSAALVAYRPD
ncbi:MAG: UDP-2,3-diacylglucosamine diphosphatase [Gemmatimonadota bacterium]